MSEGTYANQLCVGSVDHELLYPQIFRRKSFHLFANCGESTILSREIDSIYSFFSTISRLDPAIKTAIQVLPSSFTTCKRGQEYCILLYSEKKSNYLQNIGYIGEQLDLYLTSLNIGTLWFGIGKTEEATYEGLDFVIMIAIRKIDDPTKFRKNMFKSKRKPVEQIWTGEVIKGVAEIVRFAPSACNTQPWFVRNEDSKLRIFRYRKLGKRGIMPTKLVSYYNQIDIGIFLCFMELCLQHEGYIFERTLYADDGSELEFTPNAEYFLK